MMTILLILPFYSLKRNLYIVMPIKVDGRVFFYYHNISRDSTTVT
jgi:hypothetical protein